MKKYLILVLFVILISGCTNQEIDYEEFSFNSQLSCGDFVLDEVVINSQEEYDDYVETYFVDVCKDHEVPEIDFTEKTLIGKYAQGGGCSIEFVKKVSQDDTNKQIIYEVDVKTKGLCEKLGMSMNWVLIPKIPEGYSLSFS